MPGNGVLWLAVSFVDHSSSLLQRVDGALECANMKANNYSHLTYS